MHLSRRLRSAQSAKLRSTIVARCRYAAFVFSLIVVPNLQAAPSGGQIVGGVGSIHQSGLTTTIQQQTGAMAIDWNTFNVNVDERVQFQQPDVSSIALNRILDQLPSQINGRLDANGRIVLVNPNGLFFGNNASINVGGLIASGLDIDPMDFMNGDYQFQALENSAGTVFNAGLIQASLGGSVALLGKQIENQGMISADLGVVALAAGKQAVLTFDHSGLLGLRITEAVLQDELGIDPAVLNSGDISAAGGKVLMTASVSQDVFSEAVNTGDLPAARSVVVNADGSVTLGSGADLVNTGTVDVSSESSTSPGQIVMLGENITQRGVIRADQQTTAPDTTNPTAGQIELHAQDTLLLTDNSLTSASADTGRGGEITLLGNQIGLFDHARLALNGDTGGGSLLFGGDLRGENPDIPNASAIYIGEATSIQADAIRDGDGGRIIIYATDSAKVFGNISATGGALGGDGGFLETSAGVVNLDFAVDVGATNGSNGQWLIDPFNLSICDGGDCNDRFSDGNIFVAGRNRSDLSTETLLAALTTGDVTVETGDDGNQSGEITLDAELNYNDIGSSTLTLNAHDDIIINESITATDDSALNLVLNANSSSLDGDLDPNVGNVRIRNEAQINTNGGSFTATGMRFILDSETFIDTGSGDLSVMVNGLDDMNNQAIHVQGHLIVGGTTTLNAMGNIIAANNQNDFKGSVVLTTTSRINERGDVALNDANGIILEDSSIANDLTLISNGLVDASGGALTVGGITDINAVGGSIALNHSGNQFTGAVVLTTSDDNSIELVNSLALELGEIMLGDGKLTITASNGDITQAGNSITQTGAGDVTITAGVGAIELNDENNDFRGTLFLNAVDATVQDMNGITLGNSNITNNLEITSNGLVDASSGALTVGGITDINAVGGSIALNHSDNQFTGAVVLTTSDDNSIELVNSTDLQLGDIMLGDGELTITAETGDITQDGNSITQTGAGAVTITADAIELNDENNDFQGTLLLSAFDAEVRDANSLSLGAGAIDGDLIITTTGNLTIVNDGETVPAEVLGVGANLTIISNGGDIDAVNGALVVAGMTDITAGNGSITLSNVGNEFTGAVSLTNMNNNNVTLVNSEALVLGTLNVGRGTLDIIADGITQTGAITQANNAGLASFDAGAGVLSLNNADNTFTGAVSLNTSGANNATLNTSGALTLAESSIGGDLRIATTAGDITQTGRLNVAGTAIFTAIGNDILLTDISNDFNIVELTGNNVEIIDRNVLRFGAVDLSGNLVATALDGNIRHADENSNAMDQALKITGTASFSVADGHSIQLLNTSNDISQTVTFAVLGNNSRLQDIEFANQNTITLDALDIDGNLTLNSTDGSVGQTAAWVVGGLAELTANTDIALNNAQNDFTSLQLSANTANVRDQNGIILGDSSITNNLTLTGNGDINASNGVLTVGGITDITAGNGAILLSNVSNDFSGRVLLENSGANAITIVNSSALQLGVTMGSGALTITAETGDITQGGNAITQTGTNAGNVTITAKAGSINLQRFDNQFLGALLLDGAENIRIENSGALDLGMSSVGTGVFQITANSGDITQSDAIEQTGTGNVTFTVADGESIQLLDSDNDIRGTVTFNGDLASLGLTNTANITLGALNLSGDLTLNSTGGSVMQSGAWVIGGSADLSALNAITLGALNITDNLTLNSTTGSVGQTAAWVVGGLADLTASGGNNINLGDFQNDFTELQLTANTANVRDINGIILRDSDIANDLTLTGNGNINASNGVLTVGGSTDITAGNGAILLSDTNNNFTGAVSLTNINNNNVTLVNMGALTLGTLNVGRGTLDITADGITQTGAITQANNAGLASFDAGTGVLSLNDAGNTFTGAVSLNTSDTNNATLVNSEAITLAASSLAGDLSVTATAGDITQTGALDVDGIATFAAGNDIILEHAGNDFNSVALTGRDARIKDSDRLELGLVILSGDLDAEAVLGNLLHQAANDTGQALNIGGDATFRAAGGNSINLLNPGNNIDGIVTFTALSGQFNNIRFANNNTITLGELDISGDLVLNSSTGGVEQATGVTWLVGGSADLSAATAITLGVLDISDDLTLNSTGGGVAQTAAWVVGGLADLSATADILLDQTQNDFASLKLTGVSATVTNNSALTLAGANLSGMLDLTLSNGSITQLIDDPSEALLIDNTATFTVQNGESIELNNPFNNLAGDVIFNGDLTSLGLTNTADIIVGELTLNGDLTLNSTGGSVGQNGAWMIGGSADLSAVTAITLDELNIMDDLTLNSTNGSVGQTAAWVVGGLADLTAATNITLQQTQNDFASLKLAGVSATVSNNSTLTLAGADLSGTLDLTLGNGSITQLTDDPSAALLIDNTATFTVQDGESITLNNAFNDLASDVIFNGELTSLGLTNTASITLGALDLSGDLTLNSTGGSVAQTAAWDIAGLADLSATDAILLNQMQNDFTELQLTANTANVRDQNGIILGNSFIANSLTLTGNGNINANNGVLVVGGITNINAGDGSIVLSNTSNNFTGAVSLTNSGNNAVTLVNSDALVLGTLNVGRGTLDITADGITQTGAIIQADNAGAATFNVGNNALTLNNAGNVFTGAVSLNNRGANNVTLVNSGALELGASDVGRGTLNITAVGITQTGAITQANDAGLASFDAGEGVLSLNNAANAFTGAVSLTNSGNSNVTLVNNSDLELGDITFDDGELLIIANNGDITQASDTRIRQFGMNEMTFTADMGAITLANAGNDFMGQLLLDANAVTLADFNGIALGTGAIDTDLTITVTSGVAVMTDQQLWIGNDLTMTGGGVMDATQGALVVGGDTTITGTSILLSNTGNALSGTVSLHSQGDNAILLFNTLALQLGDITLGNGALEITTNAGDITQSGAIVQAGTGSIVITADGTDPDNQQSILLDNLGNDINSGVGFKATAGLQELRFTNIGDITLTILPTINNLTLNSTGGNVEQQQNVSWTVTGLADISAAGDITLEQTGNDFASLKLTAVNADVINNSALTLAGADLSSTLDLTLSNGSITQLTDPMAALLIDDTATFTVQDGESITLNNDFNDFAGDVIFNGALASLGLTNTADIIVGELTLDGDLILNSTGGSVAQSGAWDITGLADLSAANAILLNQMQNDFTELQLSASTATVQDKNSITLGNSVITDDLTLTSEGAIDASNGVLTVGGDTVINANNGAILLSNTNNAFIGAVSLQNSGTNAISLVNSIALELGDVMLEEGALSVTANSGDITQSAAIIQTGTGEVSINAFAGALDLSNSNNQIQGAVSLRTEGANDINISNSLALRLSDITLDAGALTITAEMGDITQTGTIVQTGTGEVMINALAGAIDLSNSNNEFRGAVSLTTTGTNAIDLVNSIALELGNIMLEEGALNITANTEDITQTGAIVQTGTGAVTITAFAGALDLSNSNNQIQGAVSLNNSGNHNVTLVNSGAITLAESSVGGDLSVTANTDTIQQSGGLSVAGSANFTAAADQNIILDNADNNLIGALNFSASTGKLNDITINNTGSIDLSQIDIDGNLFATSTMGGITQSTAVIVGSNATFTLADGSSIELTDDNNNLQGTVSFIALNNGQLQNIEFTNNQNITLGALDISGDLIVNSITGGVEQAADVTWLVGGSADLRAVTAITLGALNITNDLTLNSTEGGVGQTAAWVVGGLVELTANTDILLDQTQNDFASLKLTAADATIHASVNSNNDALVLAGAEISGNLGLTVNAGGIIQEAALAVNGNASFTVMDGESIFLTDPANAILGNLSFASSGNDPLGAVSFTNSTTITLDDLTAASVTLNSTAGGIQQVGALQLTGSANFTAANDITLNLLNAAELNVHAEDGLITQAQDSALTVAGLADFIAATDITLTDPSNQFGLLQLNAASANVAVANGVDLAAVNIANDFTLTAHDGSITQSDPIAALTVGGAALFVLKDGSSIALNNENNNLQGAVSFAALNNGQLQNIELTNNQNTILGVLDITGDLIVNSLQGDITQAIDSNLQVARLATFTTTGTITLTNSEASSNNQFGSLQLNAASANLAVANSVDLAEINIVNDFTLTAHTGSITQSNETDAALTVGGATLFTLADDSDIALTNQNNNLQGAVSFAALTGQLNNVTVTNNQNTTLGALDITGGLIVNSLEGNILQSADSALQVIGLAEFFARDISLTNSANELTTVFVSGANATIANSGALALAGAALSGDLDLSLNTGSVSQTGILNVTGDASFTVAAGDIELTNSANDFATVTISNAVNVSLEDSNSIVLNGITTTGTLNVTARNAGDITQTAGLIIDGLATFTVDAGRDIVLANPTNQLTAVQFATVGGTGQLNNIRVTNSQALQLRALTISGDLTITTQGAITDSGALSVAGLASLDAGSGNTIQLDDNHDFSTLLIQNAGDVFITDINALTIATANAIDNLTLSTAGTLTQNDQLIVNQLTQLSAFNAATGAAQDILLQADNNLTTLIVQIANNLSLNNAANALFIDQLNAVGTASVVAGDMTVNAVTAQQGVALTAQTAGLQQIGQIDVQNGDAILTAAQTLLMSDTSSTNVASGNIQYSASGDVFLAQLSANSGDVNVVSTNGQLLDNNGVALNLQGPSVTISAATGIGIAGAIDTATGLLSATNASGNLNLSNSGAVEIQSLSSVGDIDFTNTGDVNVNPGSIDAGLGVGFVIMDVNNGSVFGIGPTPTIADADITGLSAIMGVDGEIGTEARPIIYNVFGGVADDSGNTLSVGLSTLLLGIASGDRLVEIETLGEIDPAIFTDLRNYSQEDIAIRLPDDQLYEDELDNYGLLPFRLFSGAAMIAF